MSVQTTNFNSSAIRQATFDPETGVMVVTFTGGSESTVHDVTLAQFREFSNSDSAGRYWNLNFKQARK